MVTTQNSTKTVNSNSIQKYKNIKILYLQFYKKSIQHINKNLTIGKVNIQKVKSEERREIMNWKVILIIWVPKEK